MGNQPGGGGFGRQGPFGGQGGPFGGQGGPFGGQGGPFGGMVGGGQGSPNPPASQAPEQYGGQIPTANVTPPPYGQQHQGWAGQGYHPQGYSHGYTPQGYPPQGYPHQGYPGPCYPAQSSPVQQATDAACWASCMACLTCLCCSCCQALMGGDGMAIENDENMATANVAPPAITDDD